MDKKEKIKSQIKEVLSNKKVLLQNAYSKSLEQLVEDLKIYQHELEFQNDELLRIQVDLENSKNDYQHLFQQAPVGYTVLNEQFQILDCNDTFRRIVAKSQDCHKKMDFRKLIAPEFQDDFHFFINGVLKNSESRTIEVKFVSHSNEKPFVSIAGNTFANDNLKKIRLTVTDITERIDAQTKLRQSEEELRTITENMKDVIVVCDINGNIKYASPSCRFLGYRPEELKKYKIFDLVHPDYLHLTLERFSKAFAAKTSNSIEFPAHAKSGSYIWVETVGNIIFNKQGEVDRAILVVRDISDRKITEEQLLKTKELLHQTSNLARVGGWEYDVTTTSLHWSEVTTEIHEAPPGYLPDLESGINFYQEGPHRENIKKHIADAIEFSKPFDEELRIITAKGNLRWVRVMGSAEFKDGKCVRLYGIFQDINEKRLADEKLKNSEKRLQELNATKDKFFSIIAHDLKSPFNSILGFSELLVEQMQEKDYDGIEEYAKIIQDSSKRAMGLLMNLLEWSRIQTGRIRFNPEIIDVNILVDDMIELLKDAANQKSISIQKVIPGNCTTFGDIEMIGTILRNLISNSIKFTRPGGSVMISTTSNDDNTIFMVNDNGTGIKPDHLEKLFRIGETVTTHGTENERGTGLGLILCKEFVEEHGGKIWAKSTEGKGSTFTFTIKTKRPETRIDH